MHPAINLFFTLLLILFPFSALAQYPSTLFSRAEKTQFEETTLSHEVRTFVQTLDELSDQVHVEVFGHSASGQDLQLVILSESGIRTPEEARESGQLVIYLQGNIHAGEVEGKEALMTLMREIIFEEKRYLLENQIILVCPNFNPDGNDKLGENNRRNQDGSPRLAGERASGEGFDLNREGLKLEALEAKAMVSQVLNRWDPAILVDLHTDNGSWHGYAVNYAPAFESAGHPAPSRYTREMIFPWVTRDSRERTGMLMWWHGYLRQRPEEYGVFTAYSHQPRYLTNYMGLRNRIGILSETFAHQLFEKRYHATYDLLESILRYTNSNSEEISQLVKKADQETVEQIRTQAGTLRKGVRYRLSDSYDWVKILVRETERYATDGGRAGLRGTGFITWQDSIQHRNYFEPEIESTVPRYYYFPASFRHIADKLSEHGIRVETLNDRTRVKGEQFLIRSAEFNERSRFPGHQPVTLEGSFEPAERSFKAGDYRVDMAQPLAWVVFYLLEPQSDDGLVYWNFFDTFLTQQPLEKKAAIYPVFKGFTE